jgi:hypothetical protein
MWYPSPTEDPRVSQVEEILSTADFDSAAFLSDDQQSGEGNISPKSLAISKPVTVESGPGSEYWLP